MRPTGADEMDEVDRLITGLEKQRTRTNFSLRSRQPFRICVPSRKVAAHTIRLGFGARKLKAQLTDFARGLFDGIREGIDQAVRQGGGRTRSRAAAGADLRTGRSDDAAACAQGWPLLPLLCLNGHD